jgi:hypothetical protein
LSRVADARRGSGILPPPQVLHSEHELR